tara:strand:- start:154 stop:315 length:162 start_codon:yes stop_codon:yes gene_type:complete
MDKVLLLTEQQQLVQAVALVVNTLKLLKALELQAGLVVAVKRRQAGKVMAVMV